MGTISNTIATGITLGTGTYTSPLTVTSSGYIDDTGTGDAIYGSNTQAWTVDNYGRIRSTGNDGIKLLDGGAVDNTNTGTITGASAGICIGGAAGR